MHPRPVSTLLIAVLAIAAFGCRSEGEPAVGTPTSPVPSTHPATVPAAKVVLSQSGACGDAFFWAVTPDGTRAVTVTVEVRQRSHTAPTTIEFTVPDPLVKIEIQRGRGLAGALCSDVINTQTWHVDSRDYGVMGSGRLEVDPPLAASHCGAQGRLRLDGLVASDGTRFAPIDIRTKSIGCYAG
jgi:hypothetical protein